MWQLFLIKVGRALITLLACISLSFFVIRLSGDPLDMLLADDVPQSIRDEYRIRWGLDLPLHEQYAHYMLAAAKGDFGRSQVDGRDAMAQVAERIPATLQLGAAVLFLALLIGIPAGLLAALYRGTLIDRAVISVSIFGYAMPHFFFGTLLILLFALRLRLLPSSGYGSFAHLVMPALTLGLSMAGKLARFVRTSVLDVLSQPFIRTAKGKNLPMSRVILHHVFPNAAIPVVTFLGFETGLLIGGAVVTETVFAWPGVGRLLVESVAKRDLAIVQAIILLIAASMTAANFLVDLAYGWLDPRVRSGSGRKM
jgi:peptide/nickel transport system permease protein